MTNDQDGDAAARLAAQKLQEQKEQAAKAALMDRITNDFMYHPPKDGQVQRYELIRQKALQLARILVENCPVSRELSTALTHLEAAVMAANSAIARNE